MSVQSSARNNDVLSYSAQDRLHRHCSGRPTTLEDGDDGIIYGGYDVEYDIYLMGTRNVRNAAHSIIPVTTSLQRHDVVSEPTILVDGDVIRLISTEPWELVGCVDLQGRQIELLCAVSPCQSADVRHLSSGVYVARLQRGRDAGTVTFVVVR